MATMDDLFEAFEAVLLSRPQTSPWSRSGRTVPEFTPDYEALAGLIGIPIEAGSGSETGRLAKAIDAWAANELRRAGFDGDEVWPRASKPRVLPRDLALLLRGLPEKERVAVEPRILKNKKIAPADARVLGRAYVKQVDVLIAQWSRGPELLISTKSMVSSFRNNLPNRFEESYGDAKNLRGRYPLVAMGFLILVRSTATEEPGTLDRIVDMLRKLRDEKDVYDSTCLMLGEWIDPPTFAGVQLRNELVPEDLRADAFLSTLIGAVLDRTPIDMHVAVREAREHRELALAEADEAGAVEGQE
ncbi:MAG: hypothetical protein LC808_23240 [Actinobacteria bacterium]|nr:hypothetical protein [Actinomycetota bacterium]